MKVKIINEVYGRDSKNLAGLMTEKSYKGAFAALETFYYSFNNKDIEAFRQVWVQHELIQLDNPVGGIMRGINEITNLYSNIFGGSADVWVEFHDIVCYSFENSVIFAGRELGEFKKNGKVINLEIRTSRVFAYEKGKWGQIHHHGSIDNPELLKDYQNAVRAK